MNIGGVFCFGEQQCPVGWGWVEADLSQGCRGGDVVDQASHRIHLAAVLHLLRCGDQHMVSLIQSVESFRHPNDYPAVERVVRLH